jgi:hypothetical protein
VGVGGGGKLHGVTVTVSQTTFLKDYWGLSSMTRLLKYRYFAGLLMIVAFALASGAGYKWGW